LKESFLAALNAAKALATEQAAALYAEESALGKIKSQLTAFRVKSGEPDADSIPMLYRCSVCDDYAS
jgi:hypothetical protein